LGIGVAGFVQQRYLEDAELLGLMTVDGGAGGDSATQSASVSHSYTLWLWRHPDDDADPVNTVELDETVQRGLSEDLVLHMNTSLTTLIAMTIPGGVMAPYGGSTSSTPAMFEPATA
jgi:hypothetical protein